MKSTERIKGKDLLINGGVEQERLSDHTQRNWISVQQLPNLCHRSSVEKCCMVFKDLIKCVCDNISYFI